MFNFGTCVRYFPWIGEYYEAGLNGTKVLVIGDSHYGKAPGDEQNFTRDVLQMHLSGEQRINFFTNIARAITGEPNSILDQNVFWKFISFYNYVQGAVGEARARPSTTQGIDAQEAFEEILDRLQPDKILILGNFVWDMTPSNGHEGKPIQAKDSDKTMATWYYPTRSGKVIATGKLEHPSSGGFSGDAWHPVVKLFLSGGKESLKPPEV